MAETVLKEHKQNISRCIIVPGSGGCFEVMVEGKLVFSKLKEGRFPEYDEVGKHL